MTMGSLHGAIAALACGDHDGAVTSLSLLLLDLADGAVERALPLHLLALVEFGQGRPDSARILLSEAAGVERAAGLEIVALHTSHQLALLTQNGATVASVGSYYKATYGTLEAMGNRQGAALCLKSMAEMYAAAGRASGAVELLRRAVHLLRACEDPATAHAEAWVEAIGE